MPGPGCSAQWWARRSQLKPIHVCKLGPNLKHSYRKVSGGGGCCRQTVLPPSTFTSHCVTKNSLRHFIRLSFYQYSGKLGNRYDGNTHLSHLSDWRALVHGHVAGCCYHLASSNREPNRKTKQAAGSSSPVHGCQPEDADRGEDLCKTDVSRHKDHPDPAGV